MESVTLCITMITQLSAKIFTKRAAAECVLTPVRLDHSVVLLLRPRQFAEISSIDEV